jgi:Ser/Thr protein kinase RdoA (MazF antagonist)
MSSSPSSSPIAATDFLRTIADQFAHQGAITDIRAFGSGNINDTFLVSLDDSLQTRLVLQRINTQVFRQPQLVMQNMRVVTEHIHQQQIQEPAAQGTAGASRRWEMPRVILTQGGQDHWAVEGQVWRAISFIEGSQSFDTIQDVGHAQEVGYALGRFHRSISGLDPSQLADTLPGFHITPLYLEQYEKARAITLVRPSPEVKYALRFVSERAAFASTLERAKAAGELPLRLMHGDPKVNNIMFDRATGLAVSVVDLDTVKPGLVHYDIGDCLRSGCNPMGEETEDFDAVQFDPDLCRGILGGYLSEAKAFLTEADCAYLFDAARLIAFELGLRFLADYLAGDVYFKVHYPAHNLARALVQFRLTESIEAQEQSIRQVIAEALGAA